MFEKLLANLPYNPDLRKQIGFYLRRLRHEESVRRTGLVFLVLAFMLQLIAAINPPQSTTALPVSDTANSTANSDVVQRKSAANLTQNLSDANGTTAQPNDVVVYTLFAENNAQAEVSDFVMQENLGDVLDYADIVDLHGGEFAANNEVRWPSASIKSGSILTHKVTVRVKNPLPSNTAPTGEPAKYDYVMTNTYGNSISIKVPLPAGVSSLVTLSASDSLPNSSSTQSLILVAAIVLVACYFLVRARLLIDETMVVLQESDTGKI